MLITRILSTLIHYNPVLRPREVVFHIVCWATVLSAYACVLYATLFALPYPLQKQLLPLAFARKVNSLGCVGSTTTNRKYIPATCLINRTQFNALLSLIQPQLTSAPEKIHLFQVLDSQTTGYLSWGDLAYTNSSADWPLLQELAQWRIVRAKRNRAHLNVYGDGFSN